MATAADPSRRKGAVPVSQSLLADTLQVAVPLWLMRLEQQGGPLERDWKWAREFAWVLGSEADKLLFKGGKKGETARLFNDLARAIAIMAHAPGGVKLFGHRWEVTG